jgi:RNA polymerase sigma-70 factor, ECF subfamily
VISRCRTSTSSALHLALRHAEALFQSFLANSLGSHQPYLLSELGVIKEAKLIVTSDEDWLPRAQQFELQALAEIYDCYSPGLYRYALRLLGSRDAAEECIAETFSRFLLALRAGKGPKQNLQAYLYRIAHNWVTDHYRRMPPTLPLVSRSQPDEAPSPDQILLQRAEKERVRHALACLTPDQRQVVVLKFLEEWTNEEVALALGKPVGAVKSLQHRAIAALQRMLSSEEDRR